MKNWLRKNWKEYLWEIIGFILFSTLLVWLFSPHLSYDKFVDKICFPHGYEYGYTRKDIGVIRYFICSFFFNIDYGNRAVDSSGNPLNSY